MYSVSAGGEKKKVPKDVAEGLTAVVGTVLDSINAEASEKGRVIEFRDLFYAYVNNDPVYGITYILDLLLLYKRYKGNKMTVKVRSHAYVRQPFLTPVARLEDSQDHNPPSVPVQVSGDGEVQGPGSDQTQSDPRQTVTFIVPVAGQKKIPVIKRFLDNYEKEVLSQLQRLCGRLGQHWAVLDLYRLIAIPPAQAFTGLVCYKTIMVWAVVPLRMPACQGMSPTMCN